MRLQITFILFLLTCYPAFSQVLLPYDMSVSDFGLSGPVEKTAELNFHGEKKEGRYICTSPGQENGRTRDMSRYFDKNGNLVREHTKDSLKSVSEFIYDDKDQLIKLHHAELYEYFFYNSDGKLILKGEFRDFSKNQDSSGHTIYTYYKYGSDGRLKTADKIYDSEYVDDERGSYSYDATGRLIHERNGSGRDSWSRNYIYKGDTTIEINRTGKKIEWIEETSKTGNRLLKVYKMYSHGEPGISYSELFENGLLKGETHEADNMIKECKYEFDSHGNWIRRITEIRENSASRIYITERKIMYRE